jgi:hypothetical protein
MAGITRVDLLVTDDSGQQLTALINLTIEDKTMNNSNNSIHWDMMSSDDYKDEVNEQLVNSGHEPSSDDYTIEQDHILNVPPDECAKKLS